MPSVCCLSEYAYRSSESDNAHHLSSHRKLEHNYTVTQPGASTAGYNRGKSRSHQRKSTSCKLSGKMEILERFQKGTSTATIRLTFSTPLTLSILINL
jgi:hypothetical protein